MPTVLVNSNALKFAAQMQGMAAQFGDGIRAGLDASGEIALEEKRAAVYDPTYVTPPTVGPRSGRPLWEQTGNWLAGQVIQVSPMRRTVTTIGPAEAYERRLGYLNTSKRDGINRSNPAAERALPKIRPRVLIAFARGFWDEVNR